MCDGIGLSRNQRDNQIDKVKTDTVLSKGAGNFLLPTNGGNQNCLCLKLDFVPLWPAKISITPTMEQETPELAATLMEYQLKAKDVLAAAFIPQAYTTASKELQAIFMLDARTMKHEERITALEDNIQFLKGQIEAYQFCIKNGRGKARESGFYTTLDRPDVVKLRAASGCDPRIKSVAGRGNL